MRPNARTITIGIYQLDTARTAAVACDRLSSGLRGVLSILHPGDGQERLIGGDLTGIGNQAMRSQLKLTSTDQEWTNQTWFQHITVHGMDQILGIVSTQSNWRWAEGAHNPDELVSAAHNLVTRRRAPGSTQGPI